MKYTNIQCAYGIMQRTKRIPARPLFLSLSLSLILRDLMLINFFSVSVLVVVHVYNLCVTRI